MHKQTFLGKAKNYMLEWVDSLPLEENTKYVVEVKKYRERRSLDANAYFWLLVDKLAQLPNANLKKTDIYKDAIRDVGGNWFYMLVQEKDLPKLKSMWENRGIGWFIDCEPNKKYPGCLSCQLYYGSSEFNTEQMSRLISNIIQDCHANDIETITPAEQQRLIDQWENLNEPHV